MKKFKTPMLLLIMSISLMLFSTTQPAAAKERDTGPPAIHKLVFEKNTTVKTAEEFTIEVNCRDVDRQTIDAPITVTHADAGYYFTEFTFDKGYAVLATSTGYHERSPEKVIINKTRPPNKV
jgi:hypothetical protein